MCVAAPRLSRWWMTHREQQCTIGLHQNLIQILLMSTMTSVEEMLEQDVVVTVLSMQVTMPLLCLGVQVPSQGRGEAG